MPFKPLLLVFVFFVACLSRGVCQNDSILSLADAIELAKKNYPSVKAKSALQLASLADLKTARSSYVPDFLVQAQALNSTSNQVRGVSYPNAGTAIGISGGIKNDGTNTNDMVWTSFATALIDWKVFSFGKVKSQIDLAKAGVSKSQADFDNEVFQQQIKVCDAYLASILFDEIVKAEKTNLDRVQALKNVVIAYSKSGLKSGVDSSLVNAEYSKAYMLLLESQQKSLEQKNIFKEMLGISNQTNYSLDTSVFLSKTPENIPLNNEVAKNPLLNFYQAQIEYNRQKIKTIEKKDLPSISILASTFGRGSGIADKLNSQGGFVYDKSFSGGTEFRAYDYFFGFSAVWNLTNSFRDKTEGRKQLFLTQESEENYNLEKLKLESDLERANLRFNNTKEIARQAPIQLAAATDAYRQSKARYDNGLNTIIELTQTYALLNRSEVDLTVANGNTWLALLSIAAAAGNMDLFIQNIK